MRTFKGLLLIALAAVAAVSALPLDDYVALPDSSYKWELANTVEKDGYTFYVLKLTSQTWLTYEETNWPVWQHWVRIAVPDRVTTDIACIYINGGSTPLGSPPSDMESFLPPVGLENGAIIVELNQVPNQPIQFADEDFGRVEDAFLAKTWDLFYRTRDPYIVGRMPMVKAAVRAMDAISEFVASYLPSTITPERYVLAGGSKRGWVTWLAAAVDNRVVGAAPMVIDVLNMHPNFHNIYQTYGRWPVALKDYIQMNVTRCLDCEAFEALAAIEDPQVYLDRFRSRGVPILAVNAVADEFFVPENSKYWFPDYDGEKFLMYVPNAEHSMAGHIDEIVGTLSAFLHSLIEQHRRPRLAWDFSADGTTITLTSDVEPVSVKLWQAYNEEDRVFMLNCYLQCWWRATEMEPSGNGTWVATVESPEQGYLAFLVQAEYRIGTSESPFLTTSGVSIVPQTYDQPPCGAKCAACDTCLPDPNYVQRKR